MELVRLSDGAQIATSTTGTASELPPLVLLHGGPGLWDYLAAAAALVDGTTVVHRYDQRGCGRSSASDEQSIARYVADLEELRQHWGHERIAVVGHSAGADLALAYAAAHPERVAAVGYLSGAGIGDWHGPYAERRAELRRPFAARLAELKALEERSPAEEIEWRTLQWVIDYADPDVGRREAARMAAEPYEINRRANAHLLASDAEKIAWAAAIGCPVTFAHGALDPHPVATVAALAAHARRPRKRIMTAASHMPWVDSPDELREVLVELLHTAG